MRRAMLLVACLLAVSSAEGQATGYEWPRSLTGETRVVLTRIADSARIMNLPVDAIVAKAAEGVLKGADDARIIRAARTLLEELTAARAALPAGASPTVLNAAASALHARVPMPTLSKIVAAGGASETELAVGLVAVADLAASGVPPADAGGAIIELLRRRAPESDIAALRTSVARDIAAGSAPGSALGSRMDRLLRTLERRKEH